MTKTAPLAPLSELFQAGGTRLQIAQRLIAGDSIKTVRSFFKLKNGVEAYQVRKKLVAAGHMAAGAGGKRTPVIQFHPETLAFKIKAMLDAGKTDEEIFKAGYSRGQLYATRHQIKKKIEAGRPGTALMVHEPKKRALKSKTNGHANGHALTDKRGARVLAELQAALSGPDEFDVPVVEAILHTPGGAPVRVFASADIFPVVYAKAVKATGFR